MAPAAKKGSKKVQSFVVDCTRPVRDDSFARIVLASESGPSWLLSLFYFSEALFFFPSRAERKQDDFADSSSLAFGVMRS